MGTGITATAGIILQQLDKNGIEGVVNLITGWFKVAKKIMFLTEPSSLKELKKNKLVRKGELY
ncbi:MAG TPA: hypothetical protein ENI61_05235 [Ignavibacteria bacterium]|nr:hypothetical protein [Ignavibacteria bacterium]